MTRLDALGRRISPRLRGYHDAVDTWTRHGRGPGQWADQAACRGHDPELFFPIETGKGRWPRHNPNTAKAKEICADCPVKTECLTHALNTHESGIWGGMTDTERDYIRRTGLEGRRG